ncbi:MAG: polyamine aminopropyltransferase [Candidatus Omnitrophota bacterium]
MWFYENLYSDLKVGFKSTCIYKKKTSFQDMQLHSTGRYGKMLILDGVVQTTEKDEFIYHEMMTHPILLLHPEPKNVLIIGGGDGGILREVLKYKIKKVVLVEIDKEVVNFSKKYLKRICGKAFDDRRLNLVINDGAKFINSTKEKFDVIIIDSSDPIGPAKVLFSKKFYQQIYKILSDNGIMIRQTGSTMLQPYILRNNYKSVKQIFPFVSVQIAAIPTYIGGFFSFIIASKELNPENIDIKLIEKKYNNAGFKTNYYNPRIHLGSLCLPIYIGRLLK